MLLSLIGKIISVIQEKISSVKKTLMDYTPFERYYALKKSVKKYYGLIIKPVLFLTGLSSLVYIVIALAFKWGINGIFILIIFLSFLIYYIVMGVLYGEDQKGFYFKDD